MLWLLVVALGLLMTPFAPALAGVEPPARRAYGVAIAGELLVAGAGVAVAGLLMERPDGLMPWLVGATLVPLGLAVLTIMAVRDERHRDGVGWVPTAVLAAFPVFLGLLAAILLSGSS